MYKVELVRKMSMDLGEGPVWRVSNGSLYFVDILKDTLYRLEVAKDELSSFDLPGHPGCFTFGDDGLVYLMLEKGLYSLDEAKEEIKFISAPDTYPRDYRFNDGKCSPDGRFYVGDMENSFSKAIGSVYMLDTSMTFTEVIPERFIVPNGLAWSHDRSTFYHVDTMGQTVYAYAYDEASDRLGEPTPAIVVGPEEGNPDGMTIDDEGMLWVCHWTGYKVCRYNPETGQKLDEIKLPCDKPTSCVFGGPDMKDLYITTASIDDAKGDLAGSIFKVGLDVGGQELFTYKTGKQSEI